MENTKKTNDFNSIVEAYEQAEKAMHQRLRFASEIIRNVLNKFPREMHPEELNWAWHGGRLSGFTVKNEVFHHGMPQPVLHFNMTRRNLGLRNKEGTTTPASIPMQVLQYEDPIAVAQYARGIIRENQRKAKLDNEKRIEEVTQQIADLEKQRVILQDKVGKNRKPELKQVVR